MSTDRRFASSIDRRAILRGGVAAGIALPFGIPSLVNAQDHGHGTPEDGYVGSDPSAPTTGNEEPRATEITPFQRYDPFLEPVEPGPKTIETVAADRALYVAKDVPFAAWTFDGTVPGNKIRARVGDEIDFTFRIEESASTAHSLDFHSAEGNPHENYNTILPGEEFSWTFTPRHAGAYMYHCGTPPVLLHIGAGMYGAMIVDPEDGWPTEAQEIVLVQSDFYFEEEPNEDGIHQHDYGKMLGGGMMDYVVFNGHATQYVDEPIKVKAGEPLRIFVVNAGPNVYSTFHVVGGIFDAGYFNANPENKIVGLQSMMVGPGDGIAVELTLKEPGVYPAVNHAFGHAAHGAIALLEAE
ncbi:MAG TPA: multicopper oxidase domain-containing protein [Thermomicrobiales bacterium]|nr:multicopper oxidase domain-containing protein [Thermomicrobiales bacterium]